MIADIQTAKENLPVDREQFVMKVGDKVYADKKEVGTALVEMCKEMKTLNVPAAVGEYAGFKIAVSFDSFKHKFVMNLKGQLSHNLEIGSDPLGNIVRINHALESMPKQLAESQTKLERIVALNALLNMDEKGDDALGMDDAPGEENESQETSGHDVQKSEQGANISEKTKAEEKAAVSVPYPAGNTRPEFAAGNGSLQGIKFAAAMTDKPVQRTSLKEKLEAFKVRAAGVGKPEIGKAKGKEETL